MPQTTSFSIEIYLKDRKKLLSIERNYFPAKNQTLRSYLAHHQLLFK